MLDPAEKQQARQSAEDYLVRLTSLSPNEIRQSLTDPLDEVTRRRETITDLTTPQTARTFPEIKITLAELPRRSAILGEGIDDNRSNLLGGGSGEPQEVLTASNGEFTFTTVVITGSVTLTP